MSERTKRMKERLFTGMNPISTARLRIQQEVYKQYPNFPPVVIEAKEISAILNKLPIWIGEDELIVGAGSSKQWYVEADIKMARWDEAQVSGFQAAGYDISDEDVAYLLDVLRNDKRPGRYELVDLGADDRMDRFLRSGYCHTQYFQPRPEGKPKGTYPRGGGGMIDTGIGDGIGDGMACIDYAKVIRVGCKGILEEIREARSKVVMSDDDAYERALNLDAMEETVTAFSNYGLRYAALATEMAAKEADPVRKAELEQIAEICTNVPANPARNFREAIQFAFFLFLARLPAQVFSLGRMDYYLYPYYKADKEAGIITDEEVIELFECIRFKFMEQELIAGLAHRDRAAGKGKWHNCVIAGTNPDGTDGTNELTYFILEALMRSPTPHHTITVAVAETTPQSLLDKAIECQALGLSMPAFVSDKSYTEFFVKYANAPIEEARTWVICGCLDAIIPGKNVRLTAYMTNPTHWFEGWLNDGVDTNHGIKLGPGAELDKYQNYEEFYEAFKKDCLFYYQQYASELVNTHMMIVRRYYPQAFSSAFMNGTIEKGLCMWDNGWSPYDTTTFNPVGLINLAHSLYNIKELVYDRKVVTLSEMKKALDANWEGYEELRQMCLKTPKYGNDIDAVDDIVVRLYDDWADGIFQLKTDSGRKMYPCAVSITAYDSCGKECCATPDGRFKSDILADGCASPATGTTVNGFTSVLKSAMKIDMDKYTAFLLNQKFSKDALKTPEDRSKLASAVRAYLTNGGKHIQFLITDGDELIDAKKNPDAHRDLMVRVAGFSAYFVNLTERCQDQLIARDTHASV